MLQDQIFRSLAFKKDTDQKKRAALTIFFGVTMYERSDAIGWQIMFKINVASFQCECQKISCKKVNIKKKVFSKSPFERPLLFFALFF
jgi:hypothetical protein